MLPFCKRMSICFANSVEEPFEPPHDKTNNMAVRRAKTQIILGIHPVWSESSLSAWRKVGNLSPIHTKQLVACNLSQAIFIACNLTVHIVRQIAEIFTCKIFPAKTCLEHVEVCMIITMKRKLLLCIVVIALAVRQLQRPQLRRNCWTWILRRQVYGAHQALI